MCALETPYTFHVCFQSQLDSALFPKSAGHRHRYVSINAMHRETAKAPFPRFCPLYHMLPRLPEVPRVYHHPVTSETPLRSLCGTIPPGDPNHHVTCMVACLVCRTLFLFLALALLILTLTPAVEGIQTFQTNDIVVLQEHPTLSSNVMTTLFPKTGVAVICKVIDATNAVNDDPWWLLVEVPSQGIAGWVSDWYVECSGPCPGRIC